MGLVAWPFSGAPWLAAALSAFVYLRVIWIRRSGRRSAAAAQPDPQESRPQEAAEITADQVTTARSG
jgi:hypothetical protein